MRRIAALAMLTVALGGCSMMHRMFGTKDAPAYAGPNSTAVWGTWVLRSPDSTSFVGAQQVQLDLQPGSFSLTADYPGRSPVVVSGTASLTGTGLMTLVPSSGLENPIAGRSLNFISGQPIALLASAAGNTLVFAPANRDADPTPSSIWHRLAAAEKAGLATAQHDSTRH